ncbi:MAG TPA: glycosyltransferase [Oscillospiraceae bacterium]|nr:glycosyltransferase [Oscillospiraceae bacterium]
MIPKIIHYCHFGQKKKSKLVNKCIKSWKKFLPDYEIIEWNESNFDVTVNSFVLEAYKDKNFAFVSDYARAYALNRFGGIYLDTDVEVLKSLDEFLTSDFFAGFESGDFVASCLMGSVKSHPILTSYTNHYDSVSYFNEEGNKYRDTSVVLLTRIFEEKGFKRNGKQQEIDGIKLYPTLYFSPYDYIDAYCENLKYSYAVHHFAQSWLSIKTRAKTKLKRASVNLLGQRFIKKVRKIY